MVPPLERAWQLWQLWSARRFPWQRHPWQRPAHWAASHRLGHPRASLGHSSEARVLDSSRRPPTPRRSRAGSHSACGRSRCPRTDLPRIWRLAPISYRSPTDLPSTWGTGRGGARRRLISRARAKMCCAHRRLTVVSALSTPRIYYPSDLLYPSDLASLRCDQRAKGHCACGQHSKPITNLR